MGSRPKIDILHADDHLLVVSKPAGLLSVPDRYAPDAPHLRAQLERSWGRLWMVHRLDRETSGVMVLARNEAVHQALNTQFSERTVEKGYHALVESEAAFNEETVALPLRVNADRQHRTRVDQRSGKPATTHLRLLERLSPYLLVEARPETGRTHQVRVHLAASIGPIVCDPLYGKHKPVLLSALKRNYVPSRREERPLLARLGLHAASLRLTHPASEQPLLLEAPYPKDFSATLRQLRRLRAADPGY